MSTAAKLTSGIVHIRRILRTMSVDISFNFVCPILHGRASGNLEDVNASNGWAFSTMIRNMYLVE